MDPPETVLPPFLEPFFWDYDFSQLSWEADRELIIQRVLRDGSWQAVRWLWQNLGDGGLRRWISDHQGGGLDPRQLRFWEMQLGLDRDEVDRWIARIKNSPWGQRIQP